MAAVQAALQTPRCIPHSASYFTLEGAVYANGISADLRCFGWREDRDSILAHDLSYVDYALHKRSDRSVMRPPGERHFQMPGRIVVVAAGDQFATRCKPSDHRSLCVTMNAERMEALFHDASLPALALNSCMDVRSPGAEIALIRLAEEIRSPGFASSLLVESLAIAVMVELLRDQLDRSRLSEDVLGKLAGWRLRRVKDRIAADLARAPSIESLAAECRMSSRHLMRTFKNTEGKTIAAYIHDARLGHARTALAETDRPVQAIAASCGFTSTAAFSAAFRRAVGQAPRDFRAVCSRSR